MTGQLGDDAQGRLGEAWDDARLPRYNLAVIGATGAGKSTLINAVFGEDLAATGVGAPVTQQVSLYTNDEGTLGLYDFTGVESFDHLRDVVRAFKKTYAERAKADEPIHGIWFCVKAADRRFDQTQRRLVEDLAALDVPVFLVLTQTPWKAGIGFPADVQQFVDYLTSLQLPIETGSPVPVAAVDDPFAGTQAFGLEHLVEVSLQAAPKGVGPALAAAQDISTDVKRGAARRVIALASTTATGIGAIPIPVADAVPLMAVQVGMLRRIASIYGISLTKQATVALVAQLAGALAGKTLATSLLKLVPGAGWVITGAVAGGITTALGYAWLKLCENHRAGRLDLLDALESNRLAALLLDIVAQNLQGRVGHK
ncbi:YcjF family protein [Pseudoclavibacter sp. 13-3]|uniref:YcjF family protein n=1 Tax=Pseudoclavibacter sp. 13-3 TaxID=2901228 RepID=UPI001E5B19DE|nr:DUF697 domain-containing protein [Pseudoclavibacter sp. 13-3]MCD7100710.1 GTP-binding DUF697 domain-containing protein [Pseudoclavibacter sp. 13-3]